MVALRIEGEFRFQFNEGAWLTLARKNVPIWLGDYADAVVGWAKYYAPKRTGAGARSIHWEYATHAMELRIGPDELHKYMIYQELGTRYIRPRPHLRPALVAASRGASRRPGRFPTAGIPLDRFFGG